MQPMNADIQAALDAVADGRLDALPPERVAQLAAYLEADPIAAARVAGVVPPIEPAWQVQAPPASAEAWERVWRRVAAAGEPAAGRRTQRVLRLWRPIALAAAACALLAVGLWEWSWKARGQGWPVEWARDVQIEELEVADGTTPFVIDGGTGNGISVIWILDAES
jgi:hypothetical protein